MTSSIDFGNIGIFITPVGVLKSNSIIIYDKNSKDAIICDAGGGYG
jgi:hypothetical protein